MKRDDFESLCEAIVKHAPNLREAGVLEVELGDVKLTLAPIEPEPADGPSEEPDLDVDPLEDTDTYGGHVPGFPRPPRKERKR
ncbi:MAG TPA: hypothetical protein VM580_26005 [Labilithrix sp.]|jgi:hypothetical protein|nr:hypothetical protein [Labilithrix sp.]